MSMSEEFPQPGWKKHYSYLDDPTMDRGPEPEKLNPIYKINFVGGEPILLRLNTTQLNKVVTNLLSGKSVSFNDGEIIVLPGNLTYIVKEKTNDQHLT